MHSNTNGGAKSHLNISHRLALRLTQLSGAAICGAMTLAVLSVLLIARDQISGSVSGSVSRLLDSAQIASQASACAISIS